MLKKLFTTIKKGIFSTFLLYGVNLVMAPLNILIPINVITILILTILGIPGLLSLIFILLFVF